MASAAGAAFSEEYARFRSTCYCAREGRTVEQEPVPEEVLQAIWYDQLFDGEGLRTVQGHSLRVHAPGWWNRQAGPDFRHAQIMFNGKLHTGDVEVHRTAAEWRGHGHHLDARYDDVILHVVFSPQGAENEARTSAGRGVASLVLAEYVREDLRALADVLESDHYIQGGEARVPGDCSRHLAAQDPGRIDAMVRLAGEWRMLAKARAMRERMERCGPDQAVYEAFMYACGFGHFKHHFRAVARQLPYERARQLAQQDPLLLEAAMLQIGGLLPESLPEGDTVAPHYGRLRALRRDYLEGLRSLPLEWRRVGVRPANNPERRMAGAARFVARTAGQGLSATLQSIWLGDCKPLERRRAFEALFPGATGFWASRCTWTGKKMAKSTAPLGQGRVRSIIGNVFVPAALAAARQEKDRPREERVHALFASLPKEPDNHVVKRMTERIHGPGAKPRLDFQLQQGLLQLHADWCETNPSCHRCTMLAHLGVGRHAGEEG